jgi:DNA-binding NtrC family response regulator
MWPGNVREPRNVLERAAILSDGDIECRHLSVRPKMRALSPPSDLSTVERGNDLSIVETDRKYQWSLGRRPDDHPGLSELGL